MSSLYMAFVVGAPFVCIMFRFCACFRLILWDSFTVNAFRSRGYRWVAGKVFFSFFSKSSGSAQVVGPRKQSRGHKLESMETSKADHPYSFDISRPKDRWKSMFVYDRRWPRRSMHRCAQLFRGGHSFLLHFLVSFKDNFPCPVPRPPRNHPRTITSGKFEPFGPSFLDLAAQT